MIRTLIGGLVGGLILFVAGFVFWATPLGEIAYSRASDMQNAEVQLALAQNLTTSGSGTYQIPHPTTAAGAQAYSRGPIAIVHFSTGGFSPEDMSMLLPGLIVAIVAGLLLSLALSTLADGRSFAATARLVVPLALAFTTWEFLASPIFNHFAWRFWIYSFVVQSATWILAGLVIARWFVPRPAAVPVAAEAVASPAGD
jgi:hypothetical protein